MGYSQVMGVSSLFRRRRPDPGRSCLPVSRVHMRILMSSLTLLLLTAAAWAAEPVQPDVSSTYLSVIKIKEKGGEYQAEAKVTRTFKLLTERSLKDVNIPIGEDPHCRVDKVKARVNDRKFDHHVGQIYPQQEDVFFNEARVLVVTPGNGELEVGDELKVTYRVRYDDLAYLPLLSIPNVDLLTFFELRFEHPDDLHIDFIQDPVGAETPGTVTRPDDDVSIFRVDDLERRKERPFFLFDDSHGFVLASVTRGEEHLTPNVPGRFSQWYNARLEELDVSLPDTLAADLADSLDAVGSEQEQLRAIHDFVRRNIRYVHDAGQGHRFVPAPPADVLANRYGDCKDRALLVQALARRLDLDVEMALVTSHPHMKFDGGTSVYRFNHVINAHRTDAGWQFFDPTGRHAPFGGLPEPVIGRRAFILEPGAPEELVIPSPSHEPQFDMTVTATAEDLEGGRARVVLRGHRYQLVDAILEQETGLDQQNALAAQLSGGLYKLKVDSVEVVDLGYDEVVLEARVDLSRFVVNSPSSLYVPRIPFAGAHRDALERADDDLPVHLPGRQARRLRIDLLAPGLTAAADSTRLGEDDVAVYAASLTPGDDGHLHIEYSIDRQSKIFAGADKARYIQFCRDYLGNKRNLFTLKRGSS